MPSEPDKVTEANLAKLNTAAQTAENEILSPISEGSEDRPQSVRSTLSFSQRTMDTMNTMIIRSILAVNEEPKRLPTERRKAPLSVPTTAVNFRGFVQKSGPMFVFQDGVESTLMWDDWLWTSMWMGIWAVVSLHPRLFICVPPAIAITIMCNTFFIRFPITDETRNMPPGDALRSVLQGCNVLHTEPTAPPIEPRPVVEGEMKYFLHMRDIQNMMRLIIDGYDHISPVVKYLNWSDVPRTLRIFQASIVVLVLMYLVAPLIPWRLLVFLAGEFVLIHHHPWLQPALNAIKKHVHSARRSHRRAQRQHRLKQRLLDMLDEDRLPEYVWERGWKNVEVYENQRLLSSRQDGVDERSWGSQNLKQGERQAWTRGSDGFSASDTTAETIRHEPEEGYEWIDGDDWRIDWGGAWSRVGVDDQGYVYTDNCWSHPAPYAYGVDASVPKTPSMTSETEEDELDQMSEDEISGSYRAVTRRRRWLRRAVKVAETKS